MLFKIAIVIDLNSINIPKKNESIDNNNEPIDKIFKERYTRIEDHILLTLTKFCSNNETIDFVKNEIEWSYIFYDSSNEFPYQDSSSTSSKAKLNPKPFNFEDFSIAGLEIFKNNFSKDFFKHVQNKSHQNLFINKRKYLTSALGKVLDLNWNNTIRKDVKKLVYLFFNVPTSSQEMLRFVDEESELDSSRSFISKFFNGKARTFKSYDLSIEFVQMRDIPDFDFEAYPVILTKVLSHFNYGKITPLCNDLIRLPMSRIPKYTILVKEYLERATRQKIMASAPPSISAFSKPFYLQSMEGGSIKSFTRSISDTTLINNNSNWLAEYISNKSSGTTQTAQLPVTRNGFANPKNKVINLNRANNKSKRQTSLEEKCRFNFSFSPKKVRRNLFNSSRDDLGFLKKKALNSPFIIHKSTVLDFSPSPSSKKFTMSKDNSTSNDNCNFKTPNSIARGKRKYDSPISVSPFGSQHKKSKISIPCASSPQTPAQSTKSMDIMNTGHKKVIPESPVIESQTEKDTDTSYSQLASCSFYSKRELSKFWEKSKEIVETENYKDFINTMDLFELEGVECGDKADEL